MPETQGGLFGLKTIGDQASQQMHHKPCHTAMPGVLNLADVLQLVVDRLNERPFAEKQLIPPPHEPILHVLADFGQEFESLSKEGIVQGLGNIAPITKELAESRWGELGTGCRSSTWPGVRQKARSSPSSLTIKCSLKP